MTSIRLTTLASLTCALALGLAFGLVGCGSSSANGNTAGSNGSVGGSHGTGGANGGGGLAEGGSNGGGGLVGSGGAIGGGSGGTNGSGGTCGDIPPCLTNLISGCTPTGTCVEQSSGSVAGGGIMNNTCYGNGVKESVVETIDATFTNATFVITYSKSGTTCFTEEGATSLGAGGSSGTPVYTIKNGAGTVVATFTNDVNTGVTTVMCGGHTYAVNDMSSCGMSTTSSGTGGTSGSTCTQGSCP